MNIYKKTLLHYWPIISSHTSICLISGEIKTFIANEVVQPFQSLIANNLFNQQVPKTFFDNLASTATIVKEFIETTGKKRS